MNTDLERLADRWEEMSRGLLNHADVRQTDVSFGIDLGAAMAYGNCARALRALNNGMMADLAEHLGGE